MAKVANVIVSGPVGCGKSAIVEEIAIALKAVGFTVEFADPEAVRRERNMVGDHQDSVDLYRKDTKVLVGEQLLTERAVETRVGGKYEMPDGRSFWLDGPVAREIARRALSPTQPGGQDA